MKKKISPALKKKITKHLHGDMKTYKEESNEDKELLKTLHAGNKKRTMKKPKKKPESRKEEKGESKKEKKFERVMKEMKAGKLHSGSKKGPIVKNPKQAIAIAFSEKRRVK